MTRFLQVVCSITLARRLQMHDCQRCSSSVEPGGHHVLPSRVENEQYLQHCQHYQIIISNCRQSSRLSLSLQSFSGCFVKHFIKSLFLIAAQWRKSVWLMWQAKTGRCRDLVEKLILTAIHQISVLLRGNLDSQNVVAYRTGRYVTARVESIVCRQLCVYHKNYCSIRPWAQAAHPYHKLTQPYILCRLVK